jgi:hypothetical protein
LIINIYNTKINFDYHDYLICLMIITIRYNSLLNDLDSSHVHKKHEESNAASNPRQTPRITTNIKKIPSRSSKAISYRRSSMDLRFKTPETPSP